MNKLNIVTSVNSNTKTYTIKNLTTYNPTIADESYWLGVFDKYINDFIHTVFGDKIPNIKVKINKKISRAQARFCYNNRFKKSCYIEVSSRTVTVCKIFKDEQVVLKGIEAILKHEAIHYALYYLGESFNDGDHTFETLIAETRSVPSGGTSERLKVKGSSPANINFGFEQVCPKCSDSVLTTTGGNRYYCPKCSNVKKYEYVFLKKQGIQVRVTRNVKFGTRTPQVHALGLIEGDCKKIKSLSRFIK